VNTQPAAFFTNRWKSVALTCARFVPVSWRGAVVLCGVIASAGVCLTVHAVCDDPDDPDDDIAVATARRFVLSDQQFDQMVFGGGQRVVVANGERKVISTSSTDVVKRMETLLENEIRSVDARCGLSDAQKKKLQLAGRGDITRLLNRVSELRRKCTAGAMDQMQYQAIMVEVQALSLRNSPQVGPFGESSLLQKTLRKTLTYEQLVQFRALARERSVQVVENALRGLDGNIRTKLVGENRKKFIDTLVDHGSLPQTNSPYIQYIVWLEAGRLEDQLKPLLDESQWQIFRQQVSNARRSEQALRQSGQWPVARPADDDSPPDNAKD